jgi:hypothetical protein
MVNQDGDDEYNILGSLSSMTIRRVVVAIQTE